MTPDVSAPITLLLQQWRDGDRSVENQLATLIYPVLRDIAAREVRRAGNSFALRPTELVSDAYELIAHQKSVHWQNRRHFFAVAATVLRRVVVDQIRQRQSEKRGGAVRFIDFDLVDPTHADAAQDMTDWLAVDQALTQLAVKDADAARVVEMRLFTGLEIDEIAECCGTSAATVGRQWRFARAWLATRLSSGPPTAEPRM